MLFVGKHEGVAVTDNWILTMAMKMNATHVDLSRTLKIPDGFMTLVRMQRWSHNAGDAMFYRAISAPASPPSLAHVVQLVLPGASSGAERVWKAGLDRDRPTNVPTSRR